MRGSTSTQVPFLRSSGFPFLTEAMNMSPAAKCYKASEKHTSSRELVQTSTRASNGNDIQVLGTRVIGAVDHGTHRETERHSELVSSSTSASYTLTHRRGPPTTLSSSSSHIRIRELYGEGQRTAIQQPQKSRNNRYRRLLSSIRVMGMKGEGG